ncbi:MAG: ATP-binding cassette domain-containing protein [Alphaproteobacteria bacterium]|nr:ATP-binding cassette domain-containing protein [Alphaproteobacteria bacterium]
MNTLAALALERVEPFADALREGRLDGFAQASPVTACLARLLAVRGWSGSPRQLMEALPHFAAELDIIDARNVLASLGIETRRIRLRVGRLEARLLPCLFLARNGTPYVLLARAADGRILSFNGRTGQEEQLDRSRPGTAYPILPRHEAGEGVASTVRLRSLGWRFRHQLGHLAMLTLTINLLALAVPLAIVLIYDRVILGHDLNLLPALATGIALALAADLGFRELRGRLMAHLGARLERLFGSLIFARLIALPPAMLEGASVGAQLAKLREFEVVRELFAGRLALAALELPFVPIALVAVAFLAGNLALLPLCLAVALLLFGAAALPSVNSAIQDAGRARTQRQNFLVELTGHLGTVKELGAEALWHERHRHLSAASVGAALTAQNRVALLQSVSQDLIYAAAGISLWWGASGVIAGSVSAGALVPCMLLIWRALGPIQVLLLAAPRVGHARETLRQMESLLRMPHEEAGERDQQLARRRLAGTLSVGRLSFRYRPDVEPTLLGLDFEVPAGQMVALAGANGSGKTTVLKAIVGLVQPQVGSITVDGLDTRQIAPRELRQGIAYLPQMPSLFHGTIAQNLRLADPGASEERLRQAAEQVGVLDDILAMPEGFETRLNDSSLRKLSVGFGRRLALATVLVKDSAILLLDEPAQGLDDEGDAAFMRMLAALKGQRTVILVTHRPSHMRLCDRVLALDGGRLVLDGPPSEVVRRILEGLK